MELGCRAGRIYITAGRSVPLENVSMRLGETLDAALPLSLLDNRTAEGIAIIVELLAGDHTLERIPKSGEMKLEV